VIIVDRALEQRAAEGRPVRAAMVGAGFMGRGVVNQIVSSTPGMELVAIANRHVDGARRAYAEAGVEEVVGVSSGRELDAAAARGRPCVTDDAFALCQSDAVDVILEATGAVEFAAGIVREAIRQGKHVVLLNAELDGTVGPYLKVLADAAGVVYTAADGDQPGVQGNLLRFVRQLGLEPLVSGNVKGLQDPYRTPETQAGFAARWGQRPTMVTSFADGTKISFEQAIVANAAGLTVARRGMGGFDFTGHVDEATSLYDVEELRRIGGVVDYLVGAKPGPGVFVYATCDDPKQRHYLNLYKLGEGPLYSFYTPYHLCHFEVPISLARAVLFHDAALAPAGAPRVDVVTTAKTDLPAGTTLDGLGGFHTYGQAERADVTLREDLLPMGLAEGCTLRRDVRKDTVLTFGDVEVPPGRIHDELRALQTEHFAGAYEGVR
jgi:predicted homoserine dehydrogenase-like protein